MSFSEDLKQGVNPYKKRALEIFDFMKSYVKNPPEAMRKLPNWDWPTLLLFFTAAAALCGSISGLISLQFSKVLAGLIVFPIAASLGALLLSGFLHYTYMFFFKRELDFKLFFTIVALSLLPYFLIYTLSSLLPPLRLIGLAASGLLLIVGLSENTHIEKKRIIRLIGALYFIYFIFWMFNMISFRNETKKYKTLATPESFDKLNEEFGNEN